MKHPDLTAPGECQRVILACPWVESQATVYFWRPAYCPSNGRKQFTRMRIDNSEDPDPELRVINRSFKCSEYEDPAREKRKWIFRADAEFIMRDALAQRPAFSFEHAYARQVRCNQRLSRSRMRCRMSWIIGDLSFSGRGVVWLKRQRYYYAYAVIKRNEYCLTTGGQRCTRRYTAR